MLLIALESLGAIAAPANSPLRKSQPLVDGWELISPGGEPPRSVSLPIQFESPSPVTWTLSRAIAILPTSGLPLVRVRMLVSAGEVEISLNGQILERRTSPAEPFLVDVSNLLAADRENRLTIELHGSTVWMSPPVILQEPLVGIEAARFTARNCGEATACLEGMVTLRNGMDNTANIWVDLIWSAGHRILAGPDQNSALAPVATVPPNSTKDLGVKVQVPMATAGHRLTIRTFKNTEGIEPVWRDALEMDVPVAPAAKSP